jgi:hypothetical protein
MIFTVARSGVMTLALAALVAGCCQKYKCAPPLAVVSVVDQNGGTVAAATVQGSGLTVRMHCPADAGCQHEVLGAGGDLTASAPGFKSATVALQRTEDDCGNATTQQVRVVLATADGASPSVATVVGRAGCQ